MEDWLEMNYTEAAAGDFTGKHLCFKKVPGLYNFRTYLAYCCSVFVIGFGKRQHVGSYKA